MYIVWGAQVVSAEGCFPLCMLGRRGKAAEESAPLQPFVIKGCAETASFPYNYLVISQG